ncbi:MAG: DUF2007 domain-containing protein [Acidobacteriia bacterium]|nr:DUF2007 domain-containing protein [Terriglobia bacterium]
MSAPADLVTVYRSMDATAKEDCQTLVELLTSRGIAAAMQDDSAPGVPEGTFQVSVPSADAATAEKLIAENSQPGEAEEVDNSEHLNLETIFHSEGSGNLAEFEAMGIKSLLEANGIAAVLVGDSVLPNLPFEVRVARDQAQQARELIAEAQNTEPAE